MKHLRVWVKLNKNYLFSLGTPLGFDCVIVLVDLDNFQG
jgi:hypothetical protein